MRRAFCHCEAHRNGTFKLCLILGRIGRMSREQKIIFGEMREAGVFGVAVFCSDYRCCHSTALPVDRWPDHVRLSDIEPQFVCKACGKRGADVRPDYRGATQRPMSLSNRS
jgi:hypothetical protein